MQLWNTRKTPTDLCLNEDMAEIMANNLDVSESALDMMLLKVDDIIALVVWLLPDQIGEEHAKKHRTFPHRPTERKGNAVLVLAKKGEHAVWFCSGKS